MNSLLSAFHPITDISLTGHSAGVSPVLVVLLVIGPFAAFVMWWLVEERLSKNAGPPVRETDDTRFRKLDRLTVAVGCILVVGYCAAVLGGWLKPKSTMEGIVVLVGMLGFALFSTRRSVRDSAGADDARQIREGRLAIVMLIVFGAILGVAGWLSDAHAVH